MEENIEQLKKEIEWLKERIKKIEECLCAFPNVNHYLSIKPIDDDQLIEDATIYIKAKGKASTSMLQTHFSIGYLRALKILNDLEERGIIGPANGEKPREVLIK